MSIWNNAFPNHLIKQSQRPSNISRPTIPTYHRRVHINIHLHVPLTHFLKHLFSLPNSPGTRIPLNQNSVRRQTSQHSLTLHQTQYLLDPLSIFPHNTSIQQCIISKNSRPHNASLSHLLHQLLTPIDLSSPTQHINHKSQRLNPDINAATFHHPVKEPHTELHLFTSLQSKQKHKARPTLYRQPL
ncbi:hypothetical protein V8G54_030837 [Vigna mungo]|uniref:Uncharacterized protein n=1 Tax=Vigna mungo TaxID=3915 RepID=A0AAQ3MX81_VIGMU